MVWACFEKRKGIRREESDGDGGAGEKKERKTKAEVKWKGSKARNVGHDYKLFYHGDTSNRNGVGIILYEKNEQRISWR